MTPAGTHRGHLRIPLADEALAQAVAAALRADDAAYARVEADGAVLRVSASAANAQSLLRTLDDVITCARAALPPGGVS